MRKRLLSGLAAAALLVSLLPAALAAAPGQEEAAQVLAALDVMVGNEQGELMLDRPVTRAEFTKMAVAASQAKDSVGDTISVKPYPDVPSTHWAAPHIKTAVDLNLVRGDLHGRFNPGKTITLAEGVTIVLRLLGYQEEDFTGLWPSGQMARYRALDLDEGISIGQDTTMTRRDTLYLFYNLMRTPNTSGTFYLDVLKPGRQLVSPTGEINRVALVNDAMEGPLLAEAGWQSKLPFGLNGVKFYRAGKLASQAEIQERDVLYYSKPMRTVWAYTNRITGTIHGLIPSASSPNAVVVAGKQYAIGTPEASYALSDLGSFQVGDMVTLLLGRDDTVAAVIGGAEDTSVLCGVVMSTAPGQYSDGKGGTYTARTVTITATNGQTYQYTTPNKNLEPGDLVQVVTTGGQPQVKRLSEKHLSGRVNQQADRVGGYQLAEDVEILDTYKGATPVRIYPQRLAGIELRGEMVRYYALDGQGKIDRMVLDDVTGDVHQYGVITSASETTGEIPGMGFVVNSSYVFDLGGKTMPFGSSDTVYNVHEGPFQLKMATPDTIDRPYNLTEVKLDSAAALQAVGKDGRTYALSDTVAVYERIDGDYFYSSLARISDGSHTLTGWYDKAEKDGGRIRVIVAQ